MSSMVSGQNRRRAANLGRCRCGSEHDSAHFFAKTACNLEKILRRERRKLESSQSHASKEKNANSRRAFSDIARKKCIFVHIPKTGGTSVENLIWGSNWEARSTDQLWMGVVRPGFNKYQSGGLQHLLAKQILAEVGESTFESYFKFSFVRNPWDKAVSQFNYIKTRPMLLKHMGMNRFSSFGKYLKIISGNHSMHVQSFEQWRFILDENGKQIVDFVGRFEKLQEDFDIVARKIGLASSQLPHDMKSTGRMPYQVYYKSGMAEMISQTYAKDIEMFGYAFN